MRGKTAWTLACAAMLIIACGDDDDDDSGGQPDAGPDAAADGGDTDTDTGPGGTDPALTCELLGLPTRPFDDAAPTTALFEPVADFTVETTHGPFSLSASWTGCESHLLITDFPPQNFGFSTGIWERDVADLFARTPRNTRLLFISTDKDPQIRIERLAALEQLVAEALSEMSSEDADWWRPRVLYVTERSREIDGWVGEVLTSPGWGIGIDRFQRLRYIGSYADYRRYDGAAGWFQPNLAMAANEAVYYNFEAEREAALDPAATEVAIFDAEVVASGWEGPPVDRDVTLPDAAAMAAFDTLELDMTLGCDGDGERGTCPEWDRIVALYLCDADDPTACGTELGRWITTYHRIGRWVHDVSGLMPLLKDGGARRFRYTSVDGWKVTLKLRFSNQGKSPAPAEVIPLWRGDVSFDEVYNDAWPARTVTIPADATRVELQTVITGHGMSMPGNCAEFCNTEHLFAVNGELFVRDFPETENTQGCMDQVGLGTVPNQYGTWWYGRSGWCPGKEVPVIAFDVTDFVTPGQDAQLSYQGFFAGYPYSGDNWRNIDLTAWLTISR